MIHTNASTLPIGTPVLVKFAREDGITGRVFTFGRISEPLSGELWAVTLATPYGRRERVTNLSDGGEVLRTAPEEDFVDGPETTRDNPFTELGEVTILDVDGDQVMVGFAGDAVREGHPEIVATLSVHNEDDDEEGVAYLDRAGLDELIYLLTSLRDELPAPTSGRIQVSEPPLTQGDLDESTAGDPPVPENLRLGCSGGCAACSL